MGVVQEMTRPRLGLSPGGVPPARRPSARLVPTASPPGQQLRDPGRAARRAQRLPGASGPGTGRLGPVRPAREAARSVRASGPPAGPTDASTWLATSLGRGVVAWPALASSPARSRPGAWLQELPRTPRPPSTAARSVEGRSPQGSTPSNAPLGPCHAHALTFPWGEKQQSHSSAINLIRVILAGLPKARAGGGEGRGGDGGPWAPRPGACAFSVRCGVSRGWATAPRASGTPRAPAGCSESPPRS